MSETTKSAEEINDDDIAKTTKDLNSLTKDLIQKDSTLIEKVKQQPMQEVKDVRKDYAKKEQRVLKYFQKNDTDSISGSDAAELAREYETILHENVGKLKIIAQEDFKNANQNSRKLIDDTKVKLHDLISNTFQNNAETDFTEATSAIFASVNQKIRADLTQKSHKLERGRASLSPDIGHVFVNPMSNKTPEEIEAEKLLQQLFEEELVEFNQQVKRDFEDIGVKMGKLVDGTKAKVGEAILAVTTQDVTTTLPESKSLPNVPTSSAVQQNINTLLNKTREDFQRIQENMSLNVTENRQRINERVQSCAEKILGKDFLNTSNQ